MGKWTARIYNRDNALIAAVENVISPSYSRGTSPNNSAFQFNFSLPKVDSQIDALQPGNLVELYRDGVRQCKGEITPRDFSSNPYKYTCRSREFLLERIRTPRKWSYRGLSGLPGYVSDKANPKVHEILKDLLYPFGIACINTKEDYQAYMVDGSNIDLETEPGSILSAVSGSNAYYQTWYATFQFDLGADLYAERAPIIRWKERVGQQVRFKIATRSSSNGSTWSAWSSELETPFPEEKGVIVSSPTARYLQVKVVGYSDDTTTEHTDPPAPDGLTPILDALEVIWRKPMFLTVGSFPDSSMVIKTSEADSSENTAFELYVKLCEFAKLEFEVTEDGTVNVAPSLGRNLADSVLLRHRFNCNITRLSDDFSWVENNIVAYGDGDGLKALRVPYRNQTSIDKWGERPLTLFSASGETDKAALQAKVEEYGTEHAEPSKQFEVQVPGGCVARKGDIVTLATDTLRTTARIIEETRGQDDSGQEIVNFKLDTKTITEIDALVNIAKKQKWGNSEPDVTPPSPTQISAAAIPGGVFISWGGAGEFYILKHRPQGETAWEYLEKDLRGNSYRHVGLTPGTVHEYSLIAVKRAKSGLPMTSAEVEFQGTSGHVEGSLLKPGAVEDSHLSDAVRRRAWSTSQNPTVGTLDNIHDGRQDTGATFPSGTTITIQDALTSRFTHLEMYCPTAGLRFYVRVEDSVTKNMVDILGSAASPVATVAGINDYEFSAPVESRKIEVILVDSMEIRELLPVDALVATNVYATRVMAGIGGGTVLDGDGINVQDENGNTLLKAGRVPKEGGGYTAEVSLRDQTGALLLGPTGAQKIGPNGLPYDAFLQTDQRITPDNYICHGCELGAVEQTLSFDIAQDTYINEFYPNLCFSEEAELEIGTFLGKSYFGMVRPNPLTGVTGTVKKAVLRLYVTNGSLAYRMYAQAIGAAWDAPSTTWNSRPAETADVGPSVVCRDGFVDVDITAIAQKWVSGTLTNNGVYLKRTDSGGRISAYSVNASVNRPKLIVTFSPLSSDGLVHAVPGVVMIENRICQYDGSAAFQPPADGTYALYLHKTETGWALDTTSTGGVCLGKAKKLGSVITPYMEFNTGRKSGYFSSSSFWGNRRQFIDWTPVTLRSRIQIPNQLNDNRLSVQGWIRPLGNITAFPIHWHESNGSESGVWLEINSTTITIQAGASNALIYMGTDGNWVASDNAEVSFLLTKELD